MQIQVGCVYLDKTNAEITIVGCVSSADITGEDIYIGAVKGSQLLRKYWPDGKSTGKWPDLCRKYR